ncbi:MAG: RHS repeat-associated core domain-containing protein [Verrucomicrobiota bacterium]
MPLDSGRSTEKPEGRIYAYDAAPLVEPGQVTFEERVAQNVFTMQRQGFPQTACCARQTRDSSVGFDAIQLGENAKYEGSYRYGSGRNVPHDLVSQDREDGAGGFEMSFYSYDGLGSVRGLTDAIGTSLGNYHYDAYGLLIENTVSVANPYLFAGERFDNDLGLYYLRARYLDVETGRFHTLDTWEGSQRNAITLHKYLYANANPVSFIDPSGNGVGVGTLGEATLSVSLIGDLAVTGLALGATYDAFKWLLRKKEWVIHFGIYWNLKKSFHAFLFAKRFRNTSGYRYDVAPNRDRDAVAAVRRPLSSVPGFVLGRDLVDYSDLEGFAIPVALLSEKQFRLWNNILLALPIDCEDHDVDFREISYRLFPGPNCTTWTGYGIILAEVLQFIPLG